MASVQGCDMQMGVQIQECENVQEREGWEGREAKVREGVRVSL